MSPALDPQEAARQLAGLDLSNAELARRAVAPWWYHPALGVLIGGLLAVQAAPLVYRALYFAVYGLGLVLLVHVYRKRTGLWVSGYRAGRTRLVALAAVVVSLAVAGASAFVALTRDLPAAFVVGGVVVAVVVTAMGPLWEIAFRRDLADGRRP